MYKLLIVDDEKMIRMGIRNGIAWEPLGIGEVFTAASAKEAMTIMNQEHPEILMTDISMSGMTGLDLIEWIRQENMECRIVVLTGYDSFDYARRALKLGTHDFLLKPVDEKLLGECISKQVRELDESRKEQEDREFARRTQGYNQQVQVENILNKVLSGENVVEEELSELYRLCQLQKTELMRIGLILPDMRGVGNSENELLRIWNIKNTIMELLDGQKQGITFSNRDGKILVIFLVDRIQIGVTERAQELIELLENEYGSKVRIILGSEQRGMEHLHISYNDVVITLEKEGQSWEDVIKVEWEEERDQIFKNSYQEFESVLLRSCNDYQKFMHIFGRFLQALESYNVSNRYSEMCCMSLASSVYYHYLCENGAQTDQRIDSLAKVLVGTDRVHAGKLTEQFFEKLLGSGQGEEHELIHRVKKIVNDNLAADLSVSRLAEEVHITANYLSRIFKKNTNEGCNEYIVRKRMEKAKTLLETTSLRTGEIAGMVGYRDINYFSLAFKKHVGVAPTKYRESAVE